MSFTPVFNPYAIESHYSLDMACYLLHQRGPDVVQIACNDPLVVNAAVRRLGWVQGKLLVDTPELVNAARDMTTITIEALSDTHTPDAILMPFSRHTYSKPPLTPFLVTVTHNALSYKSLLHPGKTHDSIFHTMRWIRQTHKINQHIGIFSPHFLVDWTIARFADTHMPVRHFYQGQRAMEHIYDSGPLWWTGYILIITATL